MKNSYLVKIDHWFVDKPNDQPKILENQYPFWYKSIPISSEHLPKDQIEYLKRQSTDIIFMDIKQKSQYNDIMCIITAKSSKHAQSLADQFRRHVLKTIIIFS